MFYEYVISPFAEFGFMRRALVASLAAHRTGSADPAEPVGFLTHHLAHDDDAWRFTEAALARLAAHRAVRFSDPRTLFA